MTAPATVCPKLFSAASSGASAAWPAAPVLLTSVWSALSRAVAVLSQLDQPLFWKVTSALSLAVTAVLAAVSEDWTHVLAF
jgi:hypothetical protein